ncbi:hypothetical protein IVB16_32380 [Bradyrhizobium sp. 183]|uniref:hypothetical protein n=1 Tax=unclassified Bradyrhizobium TaxID=2631580 RepID=UPI0020003AAB|nr:MULTISPECIES: hypothetical protein [unclassified Bradyrhizobium]UPJ84466.1 hypothetical protein IVB17_32380 [Bradyrhizobium sp. 184]UPJ92262.1 hypothetical protein IVB16_32380 [Bradyrhizobium sp. 183]
MLHVDDLIEPGPEKVLLSRLNPLPWSHLVPSPKQSKASESQIKFARNPDPKARFPANPVTAKRRFQIPNQQLGISSRTTISGPLSRMNWAAPKSNRVSATGAPDARPKRAPQAAISNPSSRVTRATTGVLAALAACTGWHH